MKRARPDRGATFIELLVSVVLIGTAGIAVLTAVAASARGASVHRDVAEVQSELGAVGDYLMSTDTPYKSCAHVDYLYDHDANPATDPIVDSPLARSDLIATYDAEVSAAYPSYAALSVTDVQFWDDAAADWSTECRALDLGDRLQRLTLTVSGVDAAVTELGVVKRPPNSDVPDVGIVESPPFGSGGSGSGSGSGSFTPNPCLEGGCTP